MVTRMDWDRLMLGILLNNDKYCRDTRMNSQVGEYTVDTCYTYDDGWETAVWRDEGRIIVVDYYRNEFAAKLGHKKWVDFMETCPQKVFSVQLEMMCDL